MIMMKCYISVMLVLFLFVANLSLEANPTQGEVATNKKGQTMKEKYETVADRLDAAQGSHEFAVFYKIGEDIDSLPLAPKEDPKWRNWRRAKLDLWLRAIDLI